MRRVLLFLFTILLLLAITPVPAKAADFLLGDQAFMDSPVYVWDDYYTNPFGYWYGIENMRSDYSPFGTWTGVNNLGSNYDPFGTWTGVRNMDDYNPFGTWTGVNNMTDYDPFGTWTGVRNMDNLNGYFGTWTGVNNTGALDNPFGTWTGVRNMDNLNGYFGTWTGVNNMDSLNNPFGTWTGVNNTDTLNNPFGTWTGVNNQGRNYSGSTASNFDSRGYQIVGRPQVKSYQSTITQSNLETYPAATPTTTTRFVAPKTGSSAISAVIFAALLTLVSAVIIKRKAIIGFVSA